MPSHDPTTPTPWSHAIERVRGGSDPAAEAEALVARMTLEERLGCLDGDTDFWDGLVDLVGGGYYRHPFPAARVARLGFPGLSFCDGPRGVVVGASTCFPVPMARGASFDPLLEERIGEAIGIEARLQGADFFGGVCVNLLRHPRWGRAQETYGEDPLHVGEMGAALVRGVQRQAMACVKHFACNSIESSRFEVDVLADDDVLEDVYFPHFRRIVDEGVDSVMTAYNSLNGQWCGQSRRLIRGVLRERWNFEGIVISDFVHGLRDPIESLRAGLDVEMPLRQQRAGALPQALETGAVDVADVDASCRRIVATVLRYHARRPRQAPERGLLAGPAHRALACEAAAESIVLLRNEPVAGGPVLPIDPDVRRIAVLGRLADRANLGDGGSSDVHPPSIVTPLEGLRAALPHVEWTDDARSADLAIVVVGFTRDDEGEFTGAIPPELLATMPPPPDDGVWGRIAEAAAAGRGMAPGGDRRSLRLREDDEALILDVARVQPCTVVLLMGGSAVVVEPWIDAVAAALHVWYPGMEGGHAIADVLTGARDPGGRLPFAVPTDERHLAPFDPDAKQVRYDAWHGQWILDRDGHEARFPYGWGLSWTTFAIGDVARDGSDLLACVRNTGGRDGTTVAFAFRSAPPTWRLAAFGKIRLARGESANVRLSGAAFGRVRVGFHAHDPSAIEIDADGASR